MTSSWVALFLHDLTNQYQLMIREDVQKVARQHGCSVSVYSGENDAHLQIRQIQDLLKEPESRRPLAVLVCPVRESALQSVSEECLTKGVGWAYLCRWTDHLHHLRAKFPGVPAFSALADQSGIGRLQGELLRVLLSPGDEVVYIQGPAGTSSVQRRAEAIQKELHGGPVVRWSTLHSNWSADGGNAVMKEWLQSFSRERTGNLVVVAQNDDMAFGARRCVIDWATRMRAHLPDDLRIIGVDGVPTFGQRLVNEKQLTATVVVPPVGGQALVELFSALRLHRQPPAEVTVSVACYPPLEAVKRRVSESSLRDKGAALRVRPH